MRHRLVVAAALLAAWVAPVAADTLVLKTGRGIEHVTDVVDRGSMWSYTLKGQTQYVEQADLAAHLTDDGQVLWAAPQPAPPPGAADPMAPRPGPRRTVFVVDPSGQRQDVYRWTREAVVEGLKKLQPGDLFNVVCASAAAPQLANPGGLVAADAKTIAHAAAFLAQIEPQGQTNVVLAFEKAFAQQSADGQKVRTVVFFSDGGFSDTDAAKILGLNTTRVKIVSVAYGNEAGITGMKMLADGTDGSLYQIGAQVDASAPAPGPGTPAPMVKPAAVAQHQAQVGDTVYAPEPTTPMLVAQPPPLPQNETVPEPPMPGYVWVNGHWWNDGHIYTWRPGYYIPPRAGYDWRQPRWLQTSKGWQYQPGKWLVNSTAHEAQPKR